MAPRLAFRRVPATTASPIPSSSRNRCRAHGGERVASPSSSGTDEVRHFAACGRTSAGLASGLFGFLAVWAAGATWA